MTDIIETKEGIMMARRIVFGAVVLLAGWTIAAFGWSEEGMLHVATSKPDEGAVFSVGDNVQVEFRIWAENTSKRKDGTPKKMKVKWATSQPSYSHDGEEILDKTMEYTVNNVSAGQYTSSITATPRKLNNILMEEKTDTASRTWSAGPRVVLTVENNITECMEGRMCTFTATAPSGFPTSDIITFIFHYTRADGTQWQFEDWSYDLVEDNTAIADQVPAGDADHKFTTPIWAEAKSGGVTAVSNTLYIDVYELWIDYFVGHANWNKPWQIVVGEAIDYGAIASSDCQNWNWDMEDGVPDAWNPGGTRDRKNGGWPTSHMWIGYSDLARASNSWFGDAYGTVKVFCEDGEGNNHTFYSTTDNKKAKVFFPPTVGVDGQPPSTSNPPCWFKFWNQTNAGNSNVTYKHTLASYGATPAPTVQIVDGTKWKIIKTSGTPLIGPGADGSDILGGNSTCNEGTFHGGVISGIDLFHITVQHEMRHHWDCCDGIGHYDDDCDYLHNDMEIDTDHNGTYDPGETCKWLQNTHNLDCPSANIDAEYRTYRAEVYWWDNEIGIYNNVDWSKGGKQW